MFRPRVLIVSEHASARFGGEAILPLHYFRGLRRRGIEAFLLVHERTREELTETLGGDIDRVTFISDARVQKALHRWSGALPERLARVTLGWGIRLSTQLAARGIAKDLIRALGIHVVHQPIPVSPREPSLLYGLGAPVVMGPMNGAMRFPPAFDHMNGPATKLVTELGQRSSTVLSHLMPGKRRAAAVLYANERTRLALSSTSVALIEMPENGVELDVFSPTGRMAPEQPRFAFMGRLVDWKQVDVAIDALARARTWVRLEIVGDGPLRGALEAYACERGVRDRVSFTGWLTQTQAAERLRSATALVLPSVLESGGAVVLEAMACGVPVVATRWGGPVDYLAGGCGILVEPTSRAAMVEGFAAAIDQLATDAALGLRLGELGRRRVEERFGWEQKIDRILEVYTAAAGVPVQERREPEPVRDAAPRASEEGAEPSHAAVAAE